VTNRSKIGCSILIFSLSVCIITFCVDVSKSDFVQTIGFDGVEFIEPTFALKDSSGNRYVVDNTLQRILKIDGGNTLQNIFFGGEKMAGGFYTAAGIAVDSDENLYVVNHVLDENGFHTTRNEIVRYTKSGRYDKIIYQQKADEQNPVPQEVQRSSINAICSVGDAVIWYNITRDGVYAYTYNTVTEKITFRKAMDYPDANIYISNVVYGGEDSLVYVNKIGGIYRHSLENGEELLYQNKNALPFALALSGRNTIYFTDILNRTIMKVNDTGDVVNFLENEYANRHGISIDGVYYRLSISAEETLLTVNEGYVIELSGAGDTIYIEKGASLSGKFTVRIIAYYFLLAASGLLLLFFLWFFYRSVLEKKVSMVLKQILIYIPVVIVAIIITSFIVYSDLTARYETLLNEKIAAMVQAISLSANGDDINGIESHLDFMNASYKKLKDSIMRVLNYGRDPWNDDFYFALHKKFDGSIYTIMFLNDEVTARHPFGYLNEPGGIYNQVFDDGRISTLQAVDAWGSWFCGVGPVFDSNGRIAGLLEIGKNNAAFQNANKKLLMGIIENIIVIALAIAALLALISYFMLKTLRSLKDGASKISGGNYDVSIPAKGNDELAALTHSFNTMARSVNTFINEITTLNKAYHRFVPEEFLKFLGKESITDVALGDQVEQEMTIMFSDIIGFTSISEKLTPEENFNFINSYLSLVGPSVRENSGFIDKYIGDSIMALYPDAPDDALMTAIDILALLSDFNKTKITAQGYPPIGVGFGIHTGRLMLGILGERERVDSTVISDNVNLASRLEGLTRKFGASIIISSDTYARLNRKDLYVFRDLGAAKVKGKGESVRIYEVLDGLNAPERKERIKYLDAFEKGVAAYEALDFSQAYAVFSAIAQKCPSDSVALEFYMKMCKRAFKEKFTEGVLLLTEK